MERDVSIASASQVVGALRSRGHEVIAYDSGRGRLTAADEQRLFAGKIDSRPPDKQVVTSLPTVVSAPDLADVDLVFLAMHGGSGEDGTVQALLDLAGIAYTGSRQDRQRARLGQGRREAAVPGGRRADAGVAHGAGLDASRGAAARLSVDRQAERPGLDGRAHARQDAGRARRRDRARGRLRLAGHARALHRGPRDHRGHPRRRGARRRRDHPRDRADFRLCREVSGRRRRGDFSGEADGRADGATRRTLRCACTAR